MRRSGKKNAEIWQFRIFHFAEIWENNAEIRMSRKKIFLAVEVLQTIWGYTCERLGGPGLGLGGDRERTDST
jgi:hypothetical protein